MRFIIIIENLNIISYRETIEVRQNFTYQKPYLSSLHNCSYTTSHEIFYVCPLKNEQSSDIKSFLIRIFCDLVLVPFSIRKFVLFMLKLHSCTCYFFLLFFVHFILKPQFPLAINDFMTTYFLNPNKSSGTCNRQAYLQHHIPLLNTRLVCWNHLKD